MITYPKFSEFAIGDAKLDGEKVKLKDVLNQELLILGYAIHITYRLGIYLKMQVSQK